MGQKSPFFKCKICGQEHTGTLCTKFNSVGVVKPAKAVKPLALPAPKKSEVVGSNPILDCVANTDGGSGTKRAAARVNRSHRALGGNAVAVAQQVERRQKIKPKKAKPVKKKKVAKAKKTESAPKSQTSPHRKKYLAAKAKERRAAVKAGLSVQDYRAQQAGA